MDATERLIAGKHQMRFYLSNQYPLWRLAMLKTIKKILADLGGFYNEISVELQRENEDFLNDTVNCEIRNGLFADALSHSIQATEDLFALMKNSCDIEYFAKRVIKYNAAEVKDYINNFKIDDIEWTLTQLQLPFFDLDDPWEDAAVFDGYRSSILLACDYLKDLIQYHQKYYLHYLKYKHGLSVALRPFAGNKTMGVSKFEGIVMAFDSVHYSKVSHLQPSAMMIPDYHPDLSPYIGELHKEDNLLRADMRVVNIDEMISIAEKAYSLLSILHINLLDRINGDDRSVIEIAFPTCDYKTHMIIGFPKE